jgi:PIN domain nuclease of toxin-antitoxin system
VSPLSCWEIAALVRLERIRLDRDVYRWISDLLAEDRVQLLPLSTQAAVGAGVLPAEGFPGDPADRFLYAQARELAVPFVTKDMRIRDYARRAGDVRAVW